MPGVAEYPMINDRTISQIVDEVIRRMSDHESTPAKAKSGIQPEKTASSAPAPGMAPSGSPKGPQITGKGVFAEVSEAVASAKAAFAAFGETSLETRAKIVENIRRRARENVEILSRLAVEETGMGRVEDKMAKNTLVIEKTPGPEVIRPLAYTGDHGLTLVERAPYGVIGAITPSTNSTETIINNGIGMISAGNTVVFNAHPSAKRVTNLAVQIVNDAIVEAGGPRYLLNSIADPSIESGGQLMSHKDIRLLVVTGGPAVVKAAFASGKKVIAAGPGNPPAVVDETADLSKAARDIILGATLDNNILCIAEKEIIVVQKVADAFIAELKKAGCYWASPEEVKKLEKVCLTPEGHVNRRLVGKNASVILGEIGVKASDSLRMISCEVSLCHPFVQEELLMPVVPLVRVKDIEEAIEKAIDAEHGFAHTATMHSKNIDNLHRMAAAINTSIFVKNGPSCAGLGYGGEGYTTMSIASPTGEGITNALTFTRERRCVLVDAFRIV